MTPRARKASALVVAIAALGGCRYDSNANPLPGYGLGDASVTWLDEAGAPDAGAYDPNGPSGTRSVTTGTAPPDADVACTPSDRCIVVPADCCAALEGKTDGSVVTAVREDAARAYVDRLCRSASCPSSDRDVTTTWAADPHLGATCSLGRCTVIDARDSRYDACTRDADCELRCGGGCNFGCDCPDGRTIALAGNRAFDRDACPFGTNVVCNGPKNNLPFMGTTGARCVEGLCTLASAGDDCPKTSATCAADPSEDAVFCHTDPGQPPHLWSCGPDPNVSAYRCKLPTGCVRVPFVGTNNPHFCCP